MRGPDFDPHGFVRRTSALGPRVGHGTVTADPLDAILADVRERVVEMSERLGIRGHAVSKRYAEDDFDEATAEIIFAAVHDDLGRLLDLIHRIDALAVEVGVRRAEKRLDSA